MKTISELFRSVLKKRFGANKNKEKNNCEYTLLTPVNTFQKPFFTTSFLHKVIMHCILMSRKLHDAKITKLKIKDNVGCADTPILKRGLLLVAALLGCLHAQLLHKLVVLNNLLEPKCEQSLCLNRSTVITCPAKMYNSAFVTRQFIVLFHTFRIVSRLNAPSFNASSSSHNCQHALHFLT